MRETPVAPISELSSDRKDDAPAELSESETKASRPFNWATLIRKFEHETVEAQLEGRLRHSERSRKLAFIGGERLYRKLCSHGRVMLLDEEAPESTLALLPSALVVETCVEDLLGGWMQHLCSTDGRVSPLMRATLRKAKALRIPVWVIASLPFEQLDIFRDLLGLADTVVLEGAVDAGPVEALPPGVTKIVGAPRTFERTVAAPVVTMSRPGFRLLVSNATAVLTNQDDRELIEQVQESNLLLAECFVQLSESQLANLLAFSKADVLSASRYLQMIHFLQHCDIVLLFLDGAEASHTLQDFVLDATGCGALVIAVGDIGRLGSLASLVSPAADNEQALQLIRAFSDAHYRERTWLARYRQICAENGFERIVRALETAGKSAAPPDLPLVTVVTPTKRPDLSARILENFTRQTYPNKELVVIVHGLPDATIEVPSELRDRMRVYHAPAYVNLGFCLNEGIKHGKGEFWFKVDDDDYYGPHYLEDMMNAYAATGADIVGKASALVYLESEDITLEMPGWELRKRRFLNDASDPKNLIGATLSGRRSKAHRFSRHRRTGEDSELVRRMMASGQVLYSSDYLNFIIFRAADKRQHTWMQADEFYSSRGRAVGSGLAKGLV